MSQQGEEGSSCDGRLSQKSPSFKRMLPKVMNPQRLQNLLDPVMEPFIRRVVKEAVDSALRNHVINGERNCRKDTLPFGSRNLLLQFSNAISLPVFTRTRIQGEGCAPIEVALVDALTRQVISSGPGSLAKVKIVVLQGDFGSDEGENWTLEEFESNIVREREGKMLLLTGDVILTLKHGKGLVGDDVSFTDNSSWVKSRQFRLGARLMDGIGGIRVREARSEPFIVRNILRDSCMKRYPPSLSDEVWRLKNIRKDGPFHKRLSGEGVNAVQDFLIFLSLYPTKLQNFPPIFKTRGSNRLSEILQIIGTTMSPKNWEDTVQHARTCVLDKKLYLYNDTTSLQTKGVIFNVEGEVMGMLKDGKYVTTNKLSEAEKAHARGLVVSALEHPNKIISLNDETSLNLPPSLLPSSSTGDQHLSSHNIARPTYSQLQDASSLDPSSFSIGGSPGFDFDFLHNLDATGTSYGQSLSSPNQESDALIYQYFNFPEAECLNYSEADGAIDAFIPCSDVPVDKARKGWNILISVLRWRHSIKRIVAGNNRVWAL